MIIAKWWFIPSAHGRQFRCVLVPRILTGPDTKVEQRTRWVRGTETWQQLVVSSKMGLYIVVTFGYCYYGFGWRCYDDTLYYKYAIVSLLSGQSMSIVYYVILWIRGVCDLMSNLGNWNRYHHNPDCILACFAGMHMYSSTLHENLWVGICILYTHTNAVHRLFWVCYISSVGTYILHPNGTCTYMYPHDGCSKRYV